MFKLLETFRVVYETRNFSKAGEILFISQPSVSSQIKQLETELDTPLFTRNGRREIVATPQADLLYQGTLDLLEDWNGIIDRISREQDQRVSCRIAASHTFAVYLLPKLLAELIPAFPTIDFSIQMMNSIEVLEAASRHEIELGFIEKPLSTGRIKRFTMMRDQLVLVGQTGPWLLRETSSGVYHYTKRYLEEYNIKGPFLEVKNNEIIIELIKQGVGKTIISKRAATEHHLPYESLPEEYLRNFYLIQRHHLDSKEVNQCVAFIKKWSEQVEQADLIIEEKTGGA